MNLDDYPKLERGNSQTLQNYKLRKSKEFSRSIAVITKFMKADSNIGSPRPWLTYLYINSNYSTNYRRIIYKEYWRRGGRKTMGQVTKHLLTLCSTVYKALLERRVVQLANKLWLIPHKSTKYGTFNVYLRTSTVISPQLLYISTYRAKLNNQIKNW